MNNLQTPNDLYHNPYPDDEIDLFELVEKLFAQKWLIIAITTLATAIAVVTAFKLPVSYTTEAVLNEPSSADIAAWNSNVFLIASNSNNSGSGYLSTEEAYQLYMKYLTSPAARRYAFQESSLADNTSTPDPEMLAAQYQAFSNNLAITTDKGDSRTKIRYSSHSPEESASIVNEILLPYAQDRFLNHMNENFQAQIDIKKKQIISHINRLESNFISYNKLRLTELREALAQAQAAGITELRTSEVNATILDGAPYLLGEKLLKSRVDAINNRIEKYRFYSIPETENSTEKPYIRGVSGRVYQLEQLEKLDPDFSSMIPAKIEQPAVVPASPSIPNKKLIVVLGAMLGLMAGVFLALIRIALKSREEKKRAADHNVPSMVG
ncbi:LPS O-antigen chain length determinant protein WzzB [Endozoicomonas sp. SESOKO3]|uniref:LPS O-antigen chain length determinant protein WzzB n=1 Tax=Endozoicomonas sp. SESOKO3 TaxID=2828744 RepID=UPI0021476302|nr:Wzz/FepE/Etk N-terminal domain-containing protein [Endozoicomonas sp. SESOKO3]